MGFTSDGAVDICMGGLLVSDSFNTAPVTHSAGSMAVLQSCVLIYVHTMDAWFICCSVISIQVL